MYDWVKKAYLAEPLWVGFEPDPDGPVYFTYITRAFIEYEITPVIEGPSIDEVIQTLRQEFAQLTL
ncbi:MAG: hypothetical protein BGO90_07000 [Legionella sp. 40-6]|nr:MAG: hypothetical protein BGO90_07000 [Legionella sp. 40-6]